MGPSSALSYESRTVCGWKEARSIDCRYALVSTVRCHFIEPERNNKMGTLEKLALDTLVSILFRVSGLCVSLPCRLGAGGPCGAVA